MEETRALRDVRFGDELHSLRHLRRDAKEPLGYVSELWKGVWAGVQYRGFVTSSWYLRLYSISRCAGRGCRERTATQKGRQGKCPGKGDRKNGSEIEGQLFSRALVEMHQETPRRSGQNLLWGARHPGQGGWRKPEGRRVELCEQLFERVWGGSRMRRLIGEGVRDAGRRQGPGNPGLAGGLGPSSEVETERRDREPGAAAGDRERGQSQVLPQETGRGDRARRHCRRQGERTEPVTAPGDRERGESQALPQETGRGDRPTCRCRRQGEGTKPGAAAGAEHPWLEDVGSGRSSYVFTKGQGLLAGLGPS